MKRFFPKLSLAALCAVIAFIFSNAQTSKHTGTITGRVINEDGGGAMNVTLWINPIKPNQRPASGGQPGDRTVTDEEGNFKFTGLAPGVYSITVFETKGYVMKPVSPGETQEQRHYRVGDHVTIPMVRGGVITGRVTTASGEPMVGVRVFPVMVRDEEGRPVRRQTGGRARMTDDRGVYRLYGLAPGTYVVYVRPDSVTPDASPYEGVAPTYHPSSTRDTAAEIAVTSGGEAVGVDIRYQGERGRVVSGTVTGVAGLSLPYGSGVSMINVSTGAIFSGGTRPGENANAFAIYGVSDGDYEITARSFSPAGGESFLSPPRRVTVKGADVTGVELRLAPPASISGKVVLEASPNACEEKRKSSLEEVALSARSDAQTSGFENAFGFNQPDGAPNEKGDFAIYSLQPGRYFIEPHLPNESWYVKSITPNATLPAANARGAAIGRASAGGPRWMAVKSGEKLTGVTVTVAEGAASLRGKVTPEKEGARLPSRLRVHLVPTEASAINDELRYYETIARGDGSFAFNNIAPGKYRLVARVTQNDEPGDSPALPAAWDASERAKLRREAEASKTEIELKPCQRAQDQSVKYSAR